jgi:hypothetical protein
VLADLLDDLQGQARSAVVHGEDDPTDPELRVQVGADQLDVAKQLSQAFERVVLALDRDQELVGRGEGVHGEQPERRRTVNEDRVVLVVDRFERTAKPGLP